LDLIILTCESTHLRIIKQANSNAETKKPYIKFINNFTC